jgi:hypothetical protein
MEFAAAAVLLAVAQPAYATTWGHLRSPFSAESQQLERANFAAEERSIRCGTGAMSAAFWASPTSARSTSTFRRHAWNKTTDSMN